VVTPADSFLKAQPVQELAQVVESANSIVQRALNNRWLHEQGLSDMRRLWIVLHYGPQARV
jgi:hypothetical protein